MLKEKTNERTLTPQEVRTILKTDNKEIVELCKKASIRPKKNEKGYTYFSYDEVKNLRKVQAQINGTTDAKSTAVAVATPANPAIRSILNSLQDLETKLSERIKSLYYQESELKKEIHSNQNLNIITTSIISLFTIGQKYSKATMKEMLRKYYEENNITKNPKASDLENYFNLRPCQFIDKELGKKVNGFEIISLRDK